MPKIIDLIKTSLYIGATGYGGPAILGHMKTILVKEKKWISEKQFMEGLSLAQLLPGAIEVTLMGYIGYRFRKFLGAILMPLFFALPAFILITTLTWAYFSYGQLPFIKSLFTGLGALVIALLINALITLSKSVFPTITVNDYKGIIIALLTFSGIFFLHLNIVLLILLSGILGFAFYFFSNELNDTSKKEETLEIKTENKKPTGNKVIDIILPITIFTLFLVLTLLSPARTLFYEFFKIGMLAFGGGFTSIPLMQEMLINNQHWVNIIQFRDGIAMGQITPGPVLITAAFIGYKVMGIFGAIVSTAAIFTPSLIAILILATFHSKIKNLKLTKAIIKGFLSGFLGLILATTINFGINSLINWQTWSIFLVSATILIYFKKDPVWIILGTIIVSLVIL